MMRRARRVPDRTTLQVWSGALCLVMAASACASQTSDEPTTAAAAPRPAVPERAPTAGDELMAWAPAGADLVLELDLSRLRENPVLGPLLASLAAPPGDPSAASRNQAGGPTWDLDRELLSRTDAVLLAAYHVGEERAATLTLLRGDAPVGTRIAERLYALGPPERVAHIQAVRSGAAASLADDRALMAVRTRAMPARATGAFLRGAARLGFDARVALASQLDLDSVPATVSVWADVADDLAVVVTLSAEPGQGPGLARALAALRDRVARIPWVRERWLHVTLRGLDVSATDTRVRAVLVIAPNPLQRMIARFLRTLDAERAAAPGARPNPAPAP